MLVVLGTALGGGCSPDVFLVTDEDRERNYQRARDAERLGDFEGAAEYYERAVEKNPRSANVHLGYASLCGGPLRRYADAVYHYERYLRLRPDDPRADDIRRRITNCTERLATSVPLVIRSETIARDLEAVRRENLALRSQVTNLAALAARWSNEWRRLSLAVPSTVTPAGTPGAAGPINPGDRAGGGGIGTGSTTSPAELRGSSTAGTGGRTNAAAGSAMARTHRVQSGETMRGIARRYGVSVEALQRANRGIDPRRMKVGTLLRIPGR